MILQTSTDVQYRDRAGAGKTTLLDVLASRKNIGVISGQKLIDGKQPGTDFQRGTSYAEQLDVHEC